MNDPSSYGYQEGGGGAIPPAEPGSGGMVPSQYKFSQDEMRVLGECNRESFFQRSMPIGTVMGMGTLVAVQRGYLKPNPRFGPLPKVTLAVMVGYFIGKLSYQQACAEKLMALPGSYIGQLLRERKEGKVGSMPPRPPPQGSSMLGANPSDIYSDAGPGSSLDLDTHRPIFSEDTYRPDTPESIPPPDQTPKRPDRSYDDLRRKNRESYIESKQDPYRMDPNAIPRVQRAPVRPDPPPPPRATNQYGDVME